VIGVWCLVEGLRRRELDGCEDMVRVGSRRGEGEVDGRGGSGSVWTLSMLCLLAGCGGPLAVCEVCPLCCAWCSRIDKGS